MRGGGIEKNHSSSKKLVLSLVTISFLSSYSYATDTTINDSKTDTQTVSGASNTLVIGSVGSVTISNPTNNSNKNKQAILFQPSSSTSTFLNQGTLIGGSNTASVQVGVNRTGGATIQTFDNQGIIGNGTSRFGVTVWGKDGSKSTINNFSNSGTISSNNNEAIYLGNTGIKTFTNSGVINSNNNRGININSGVTIETFTNSGIINSTGTLPNGSQGYINGSVNIIGSKDSITSIKNFNNSGTISSEHIHGVNLRYTTIDNFNNSGIIKTNGTQRHGSTAFTDSGFRMTYAYVKTFENTGTISGFMGVVLNGSKIDQFTNKKTIMATQNNDLSFGIMIGVINRNGTSTIETLKNEGIITSKGQGIVISNNNKIETLINNGTIQADKNGIMFHNYDDVVGPANLGKITIGSNGIIKAGNDAIHIDGSKYDIVAQGIDVESGGKLEGGNAGIYIGGGKEINAQIKIEGTVTGETAGIVNEGVIGGNTSSGSTGGIVISGGSVSSSSGRSGIVNQGNGSISGEIKVESGGSVEGGITNTGNGSISGSITVASGGKLDSITNTSTSSTGISGS
ncbi:hypothetical protein ACOTV8_08910, partial [Campylobacter jejuni]